MNAVPFKPEHLAALRAQPEQAVEISAITPQVAATLEHTNAWTVLDGDEPLCCGGVVEYQGVGLMWAAVSGSVGTRLLAVTRVGLRYLRAQTIRVETSVRTEFTAGCRWAEILGFRREHLMPAEGFDGSDHYKYVRD